MSALQDLEQLLDEIKNKPLSKSLPETLPSEIPVSVEGIRTLPADYVAQPPQTDARFAFFAGALNRCFLPESQARTHAWFDRHRPGYHTLHVLPTYGHLDVFMGKDAATDTFPLIAAELERTTGVAARGAPLAPPSERTTTTGGAS